MSSFLLKIIGMITMLSDHMGDSLVRSFSFFNVIGRIAFPLFAFQMTQGYIYTKNFKKLCGKLFLFGLISQIPFMLFLSLFQTGEAIWTLNIFFTLLLGLLAIFCYDKIKNRFLGIVSGLFICLSGELFRVDYGAYGVLLIFLFYLWRNIPIGFFLANFVFAILRYGPYMIFMPSLRYILCFIFTLLSAKIFYKYHLFTINLSLFFINIYDIIIFVFSGISSILLSTVLSNLLKLLSYKSNTSCFIFSLHFIIV